MWQARYEFYLYDEGGWPSGSACGLVWEANPEKYCLSYIVPDGENSVKLEKKLEKPTTPFAIPITDKINWSQEKQKVIVRVEDKSGLGGIWKPVLLGSIDKKK